MSFKNDSIVQKVSWGLSKLTHLLMRRNVSQSCMICSISLIPESCETWTTWRSHFSVRQIFFDRVWWWRWKSTTSCTEHRRWTRTVSSVVSPPSPVRFPLSSAPSCWLSLVRFVGENRHLLMLKFNLNVWVENKRFAIISRKNFSHSVEFVSCFFRRHSYFLV